MTLYIGDLVYIKGKRDKTKSHKYLVVEVDGQTCKACKLISSQFRTNDLKIVDCYPICSTVLGRSWQGPVCGLDPDTVSDSQSDFSGGSEFDHEPVRSHSAESIVPEPPDHTLQQAVHYTRLPLLFHQPTWFNYHHQRCLTSTRTLQSILRLLFGKVFVVKHLTLRAVIKPHHVHGWMKINGS